MVMEMNDILNLATLLRENGDKVLNGQSKLSLTVPLLINLNESFTSVIESTEESNDSFHVITTNNSNSEIFHDIQFLHDFVQKAVSLKITNSAITNECNKRILDICKFKSIKYLELRKVPIHLLKGLRNIRTQLQSIVCIRCLQRLEELLTHCGADQSSGFVWGDLREAVFSYNGIDLLDKSLEFAPWLQILDISHNRISHVEAVECLPNLKYLNISYNLLESIPIINKNACRKLQVLVIKNNYIEDLTGLVMLESLHELDLSCNCLSDHDTLSPLFCLPALMWLSLEGNPLSFHSQHRIRTARHLHDNTASGKFLLDRLPLSKSERLVVGSLRGSKIVQRNLVREEACSAGSSSASTHATPTGNIALSKTRPTKTSRSGRVREAVISEDDGSVGEPELSSSVLTNSIDLSTEHLETKKQIETLRERFGEDNWLHSHAGSCVQDVLGLHTTHIKMSSSPLHSTPLKETLKIGKQENMKDDTFKVEKLDVVEVSRISNDASEFNKPESATAEDNRTSDFSEKALCDSAPAEEEEEEDELEDKDEEEEGESEEQLYLVQKKDKKNIGTHEFFLVVTERWLKEREVVCGKTRERWTMDTLQTCEKLSSEAQSVLVQLTFDTVRRDRQERTYIMEEKDAQKLIKTLGEILESRPLNAMNQLAFRCMKCSTQFSQEVPPTVLESRVWTCPTCNSTVVIQMEEMPLPSQHTNISKTDVLPSDNDKPVSSFHTSPSQSSIGMSGLGTGCSKDKLQVTAIVHHSELQHPASRSAASLDPYSDSPNNNGAPVKRWDSDIEIISNPSQSSIEVLDDQSRFQSNTPARKRSSEERQVTTVAVIPEETSSHVVSLTGLTESSSSGSLTDSICTTYEIHAASLSSKQSASIQEHTKTTESNPNEKLEKNAEPEDASPTVLFKMHEKNLSPRANYANMLEGLLQSVGSKLVSKSPENILNSSSQRENVGASDKVKYNYKDFSVVDHRVKLYLYLHVFQEEQEELQLLLRAQVVSESTHNSYPGCLVISNKKLYVLQVTGEEGDDPEQWLRTVECCSVEMLAVLFPLLWQQGVGVNFMKGGDTSSYLFILQDQQKTRNFFSFITGLSLPKSCRVEEVILERQSTALQQLLLGALCGSDSDPTVCLHNICSSCKLQKNEGLKELGMCGITITTTDLVLLCDSLDWLFPSSTQNPEAYSVQKMSNLIEVEVADQCKLTLSFLDEAVGSEESWTLAFVSESSLSTVLSTIKTPWEQLFSVPLQVIETNKSASSVQ